MEVKLARAQSVESVIDEGCHTAPQTKEEDQVEVPTRKNLRKKKPKSGTKKPEWPRCACPEKALIKPAEGVSYVAILKDIKKYVKSDELDVTVQGIRETRSTNLLAELKYSKEGRGP